MSPRKFYKTKITIVVLSEDPLSSDMSLQDVEYAITDGDCSGSVEWGESKELNGAQAAAALRRQGSDPGFFGLTAKGDDCTDEEDGG